MPKKKKVAKKIEVEDFAIRKYTDEEIANYTHSLAVEMNSTVQDISNRLGISVRVLNRILTDTYPYHTPDAAYRSICESLELDPYTTVKRAIYKGYAQNQEYADVLNTFITNYCVEKEDSFVSLNDLFISYIKEMSKFTDVLYGSRFSLFVALSREGSMKFEVINGSHSRVLKGIDITDELRSKLNMERIQKEEIRSPSELLDDFVINKCEWDPLYSASSSTLYSRYLNFVHQYDVEGVRVSIPMDKSAFVADLLRDYPLAKHTRGTVVILGIRPMNTNNYISLSEMQGIDIGNLPKKYADRLEIALQNLSE